MELTGLHHVTAVTSAAAANVDFYTRVLGMRLVKKTVNQDDVAAYHLFYGDELGNPGTELTFFDWPRIGPNIAGAGSISAIGLRAPSRESLEWWKVRLANEGIENGEVRDDDGRAVLDFADPEGQKLQLIESGAGGGTPWANSPVPPDQGLRGLAGVTLTVRSLSLAATVLENILGMNRIRDYQRDGHRVGVFAMGAGGPGAEISVEERQDLGPTHVGAGGVHHVAFRTPDQGQQARWWQKLREARLPVSPIIDRYYFHSIYFREPNGILFEIATDGPGFTSDEDAQHLGERLSLPPFLEPQREEIEAGLVPLA